MFWKPRGTKNVRTNRARRQLRIESLETRQMLSGVVQVNLDGLGNLSLVGDSSQHYVEITSTPNGTYDQFTITSKDGTLFELNGVLPTLTSVAVDGVTGDINVNLGNGGPNTFDFEAPSSNAGAVSTVLGNLTITDNSVETNKINNVVIQGNLTVVDGSNGYHEFNALGTQVNGVTEIDNSGVVTGTPAPGNFSGDSYTNITNCVFEGLSVNTQTAGNTQTVGAAAVTSDASTPLQRQTAIDNGLTYLESQQNADGSWTNSYGYNTATTALVVEALALRGGPCGDEPQQWPELPAHSQLVGSYRNQSGRKDGGLLLGRRANLYHFDRAAGAGHGWRFQHVNGHRLTPAPAT